MFVLLQALLRALIVLALLAVWSGTASGAGHTPQDVPNHRMENGSHVADPDQILSAEQIQLINLKLLEIERTTGAQVAVVALNQIEGGDLTSFAQALFERWGIGRAGHDDGLLILLVKNQRGVRFHVGYGLEGALPDVLCHRIQVQAMVPLFKRGEYGEGLLAGVESVAITLANPSGKPDLFVLPREASPPFWRPQSIALMVITALLGLACGVFQSFTRESEGQQRSSNSLPLAMRYAFMGWLLLFLVLPLLLVAVIHLAVPGIHWGVVAGSLYGYGMALAVWHLAGLLSHVNNLNQRGMHAASHRLLRRENGFWVGMAFVFPVPLALGAWWLSRRSTQAREHPRQCPACKALMKRLDEAEEDAYLSHGAQTEERVGSREHDVWHCPACTAIKTESYDADSSAWLPCPQCKSITLRFDRETTLREPTEEVHGKAQRTFVCMACRHEKIEASYLPRLVQSDSGSSSGSGSSSSSSRSSGGSSGGSSWGGGSSGGGGSNANW